MNPSGVAAARAKTREWPSFYGEPVPLRNDPFEVGQDFIRALHHRLCQPLTTLSCTLELMQLGREADVKLTSQLQIAVAQSEHMTELMSMFRQLFEAETRHTQRHAVPLEAVVTEVADDLRPLAEMKQLVITLKGGSAGSRVDIPSGALRQSLWNVVQNCIELTARGAIEVEVSGIDVVITDGSELSMDEIANIFDPFSFCQDPARTAKISNLAVALAQRLISAAGGTLMVCRAKESAGREFRIHLPAVSTHPAGSAA